MKKVFKIIAFILGLLFLVGTYVGFSFWKNWNKHQKARNIADQVIEYLDKEEVYDQFPEEYFKRDELYPIVGGIQQNCDWQSRDGKFVDFFSSKIIGGVDQTTFIYEYYLDCDSLRFLLFVGMEKEPELMGFNVEPLELENPRILFPEKQLKNR